MGRRWRVRTSELEGDRFPAPDTQAGEVLETYRSHPLRAASIVARARGEGRSRPFRERDLAFDSRTLLTDQNHVGGAGAVLGLAEAAGVGESSRILDLGSGLGGPARLLAARYGCRVLGIDLSPRRHRDARRLTKLVGLEHLARFRIGDVRELDPAVGRFDVVWGQGSWIHVPDRRAHFARVAAVLDAGGRVAFEEAALARRPRGPAEAERLRELCRLWSASLARNVSWLAACEAAGLRIARAEDLTSAMHEHFGGREAVCPAEGRGDDPYAAARERRATRLARTLVEAGLITQLRVVADRRGRP